MMNAAVFDTNVLVSGLLSPHGPPGWLVSALLEGICRAVVDDRIWNEYTEVCLRPAFGFPSADVALFLGRVWEQAIHAPLVCGDAGAAALPDPTDVPFLECAAALAVPLVTGNLKHYPRAVARAVEVRSPSAYVQRVRGAKRV